MEIPPPRENEGPTSYADRLGRWYSSLVSEDHKRSFGQYLTPPAVAQFLAGLFQHKDDLVRVLDPGAGSGILTCALAEYLVSSGKSPTRIEVRAYENDPELAAVLTHSLDYLRDRLWGKGIAFESSVITEDFILAHSDVMCEVFGKNAKLFKRRQIPRDFDVVVCNPPYFKIPRSDPRAKAANAVIHGQPNIYALFMAVSASMLKPGGQLIFITPRSYTSGPYFRLFRERFLAKMRPESVHVFESRTDAFKRDEILQENIILKAERHDAWAETTNRDYISVSSSQGAGDLRESKKEKIRADLILDMSSRDKVLFVPTTHRQLDAMEIVRSWSGSLRKLGLEISTGPVVPFRAVTLLEVEGSVPESHAPLIWMQHVRAMSVQWPIATNRKPQFVRLTEAAMKLLVPNRHYVLLRRFSAKEEERRLVAAPYIKNRLASPWLGLENHLNYIHRPGGELTEEEVWGLSVLYCSSMLDSFFRTLNGNTQVSATELRAMPLPERELIIEIGRIAREGSHPLESVDTLVEAVFRRRTQAIKRHGSRHGQGVLLDVLQDAASGGKN